MMAAERLSMRKLREVLRLAALGQSRRAIGRSLNLSHNTVGTYLDRATTAGVSWPACATLDDAALAAQLCPPDPGAAPRPVPDWPTVHHELQRKGVTLRLLWLEYKAANPTGYQYSQFSALYRAWADTIDPVLRQAHAAGEKVFVDYAGHTLLVVEPSTGEGREAQLFVGALGASNYTFAELTWSQALPDWIGSHTRMYAYFGGVPRVTVPDNLRTGVRHACFYDPDLNPTYADLATHYGTTVLPTRVASPRDKAKVETAVQICERWLLAPLRHHTLIGLAAANQEIAHLLRALNDRPFQKLAGTRRMLFDTLDRPALLPLPAEAYAYAEWKKARVNIDYHVEVERHYYSVPHRLLRKVVEIRLTATVVEILYGGQRVALHARSRRIGGFTTEPTHRPKAHQKHLEWSPDRLIRWGHSLGQSTGVLVQRILEAKPHPEQGYRACLGLMSLGKRYTAERLEAACFRALRSGAASYRSVKSILEHGLDAVPLEEPGTLTLPATHQHVRGAAYFTPTPQENLSS
jgi:transposase